MQVWAKQHKDWLIHSLIPVVVRLFRSNSEIFLSFFEREMKQTEIFLPGAEQLPLSGLVLPVWSNVGKFESKMRSLRLFWCKVIDKQANSIRLSTDGLHCLCKCMCVCACAAAAAKHADNNVCSDYWCNKRQQGDRMMCGEAEGGCGKINNKGKDEGLTLSETIKKGKEWKSIRRYADALVQRRSNVLWSGSHRYLLCRVQKWICRFENISNHDD